MRWEENIPGPQQKKVKDEESTRLPNAMNRFRNIMVKNGLLDFSAFLEQFWQISWQISWKETLSVFVQEGIEDDEDRKQ